MVSVRHSALSNPIKVHSLLCVYPINSNIQGCDSRKQQGCVHRVFPCVSHLVYSDHWDYHAHPHVHPVEFENLQETNFTELQSVQTLHAPSLIRHEAIRYDTENLLDPNLGAHSHVLQQPVSPFVTQQRAHMTS